MIEVSEIYKTFKTENNRDVYPLLGANLAIDDGEKIGILGKSGEGKSTLANIICGFVKPDSGNVYLDEVPLYKPNGAYNQTLGKKIQLIPQQPYLSFDPSQKVGASVEEALRVNVRGAGRSEAKAGAKKLFEKVLLDLSLMDRLPAQLSGGQIQRVAIARALAVNPDVIISDEATSMLDATSQSEIMKIFDGLAREDGISVIFISHDLRLLCSFADRIYRLKDGVFDLWKQQSVI